MEANRKVIIEVQDVVKQYLMGLNEVLALRGVSFKVYQGEYVSIMGSSGSGKSTLMNILGCLDKPSTGTYKLDGIDIAQLTEDQLAGIRNLKIGFIFQSYNLLPTLNVLENIALPGMYADLPREQRFERALEMGHKVGLDKRMDHMPYQLSGGQMQRVAIARALTLKPAILLADEPTGNLDSKTQEEILDLFDQLYRDGSTILMVTHELDVAERSRRMLSFHDGKQSSDIDLMFFKKQIEAMET